MKNSSHRWCIRIGIILHIAIAALLLFVWTRLPPQLPLYYSRPWGVEQIGTPQQLGLVVIGSLFLFIGNSAFAVILYLHDHFLGRLLLWGAFVLTILLLYSVWSITMLVI